MAFFQTQTIVMAYIKKTQNEKHAKECDSDDVGSCTLAFPSISTADFQFDLDRASDIIVDTAADFLQKFDNIRLVLVDLSEKSIIIGQREGF